MTKDEQKKDEDTRRRWKRWIRDMDDVLDTAAGRALVKRISK